MSSFSKRLKDWNEIATTETTAEDPEVLGGRQAETFLNSLVHAHYNFKGANLYPNKRVPAGYRRREIDLVVVTSKKIHVIETKNWSGTLQDAGGSWVQTNRNGRKIEHPDLVDDNRDKNFALIEYLNGRGVGLAPGMRSRYMVDKIIFMNRKLGIVSSTISEHPDVLTYSRLAHYLDRQKRARYSEKVVGSIIQWCLDTESADVVVDGYLGSLTGEKVRAICQALDDLGTWDTVRLHGTKLVTGDLIRLAIKGQAIPRKQFPSRSTISVRWTRNKTLGLVKALTGLGTLGQIRWPGAQPMSLDPDDTVFFHPAGERDPVSIPLKNVEGITLG